MRVRAMLAGVLVAMLLVGVCAGPVCQAACGIAADSGGSMHRMPMAGMPHCAMCAPEPALSARVAPCLHEAGSSPVAAPGAKVPSGSQVVLARCAGTVLPMPAERFAGDETPPLRVSSPVLLHILLRV